MPNSKIPFTFHTESTAEPSTTGSQFAFGDAWRAPHRLYMFCRDLLLKAEPSDLLLLTYITALARQYFWGINNQKVAWTLAIVAAGLILGLHVQAREVRARRPSASFWPVVALPLLLIYALRAPLPDTTFDVLNYHLVHAERALRGYPFMPGDFFPSLMQVNPAPNIVSGIFRHALGYRLGTLVNYLAILWVALIVDRFLRDHIKRSRLRAASVLLVVSTEFVFYLLNFYLIDLLALPLLLEATYLSLSFREIDKKIYTLVHIALFLGISIAFKLTNLVFVVPIATICIYEAIPFLKKRDARYVLLAVVAFTAPIIPFTLFIYRETGSPVFPFYNGIFKSPYLIAQSFRDEGHGPKTFLEIVLWPVWALFSPERLSEWSELGYTGRISIAYIISFVCVLYKSLNREVRALSFLTLFGAILWSLSNGNGRYALYLEILGTIMIIRLAKSLYESYSHRIEQPRLRRNMLPLLLIVPLVLQSVLAYHHLIYSHFYRTRNILFNNVKQANFSEWLDNYVQESRNILNDYSAYEFLSQKEKEIFGKVDVWINSDYRTNGIEVMLKNDIPIVAVSDYISHFDILETEQSKERLAQTLSSLEGKRMFTLSSEEHLFFSLKFIARAGLTVGDITPMELPYFSRRARLRELLFIELLPPGKGINADQINVVEIKNRLRRENPILP